MCLRILIGNHQRVCITKLLKSLHPTVQPLLLTVQHPQLTVHCTASPAFRQTSPDVIQFLLLSACSEGVYSLQYFGGVLFLLYFASCFLDSYDLLDLRFVGLPICRVSLGVPSQIRKTSKNIFCASQLYLLLYYNNIFASIPFHSWK